MFPRLIAAAFFMTLAPGAVLAMGCTHGSTEAQTQSQSCAGGTMYDAATATCVPVVSG
ncbi:adenylosuccinate lyase [Roseovarius sp. ZX-A-9]|uniref:adenylosuccinate lyase n=1 Tax=Roseovarius sp. ZX-A-9 TaxID=3014783 RepID=UPI00232D65BB|nr:adenylosuccinate lyase [Roseovarius sp. ZX-A-9]